MSHYFTNDEIKSNEKIIKAKIKEIELKFYVDNGVFSKNKLDIGTKILLENIEPLQGKVLDFGCGYGPIGIYLALTNNIEIDMIDINKRALNLAKKNALLNKVKANIFQSNIYENIKGKYDYIITNPPIRVGNKILYEILLSAYDYLKAKGQLWLVVSKNQGAKTIIKNLEKTYQVSIICKNKGFYVIKAKKD